MRYSTESEANGPTMSVVLNRRESTAGSQKDGLVTKCDYLLTEIYLWVSPEE